MSEKLASLKKVGGGGETTLTLIERRSGKQSTYYPVSSNPLPADYEQILVCAGGDNKGYNNYGIDSTGGQSVIPLYGTAQMSLVLINDVKQGDVIRNYCATTTSANYEMNIYSVVPPISVSST